MTAILFRPLAAWPHAPTPTQKRASWPNARKLTLARALVLLENELRRMGCRFPAYIEADVVSERDIRLDGQLRSDARFKAPGAVVYATHDKLGELRWACDGYGKIEQNVRAIAGTIEALRAVDRYRCVRDHEQFRGFKALPASTAPTLSTARAREIVAMYAGFSVGAMGTSDEAIRAAIRVGRSYHHPDRTGGDRTVWDLIEQAARILGVQS